SIYASKTSPDVFVIRNGDLYHSANDGGTFTAVSSGVPAGSAYFVTQADTSVFISAAGGLYKANSSYSFTQATGVPSRVTGVVHRGAEYLASTVGSGLLTSTDGLSWKPATIVAPGTLPSSLNALALNGNALIAATND